MTRKTTRWRRALIVAAMLTLPLAAAVPAAAQAPAPTPAAASGPVRIGLILDMSGPYSMNTGIGSATAAKMAVADFGGRVLGRPVEVLVADSKNSSDRAAATARDWFGNQNVSAIMDVTGSSEALIVQAIANTRDRIVFEESADAERLSNEACTATSVHYGVDTHVIANTVGARLVEEGDKTWYFITVDYSFGFDLEHDTAAVIEAHGGQVLGNALYPLGTADFDSYLARAQQSGAKVIGLANGGADLDNTIREAANLHMISGPQVFAGLTTRITGVHALGLQLTQGMLLSEAFYWDSDDQARAWSKRFFAQVKAMPNSLQAAVYSATTHYLQAVARAGTLDTDTVMHMMEALPVNDFYGRGGRIRPDGVLVHDMRLFQVKTPAESHYPWDYYKLLATVPGNEAYLPLSQSRCPLVTQ
jgi:branched-chain amino acid transport system substrate-binding protein